MKCFNQQIHEFGGISIPEKNSPPVQSGLGGLYRALVKRLRHNTAESGMTLGELKEWFLKYTDTFNLENEKHQQSILMKKKHTFDVCDWAVKIGQRLGLDGRDMLIAETAALLKLSFLFDINFDESLRILSEEGCIERLGRALPDEPEIRAIAVELRNYFLDKKGVELFYVYGS